jgi:hypothetical protein
MPKVLFSWQANGWGRSAPGEFRGLPILDVAMAAAEAMSVAARCYGVHNRVAFDVSQQMLGAGHSDARRAQEADPLKR